MDNVGIEFAENRRNVFVGAMCHCRASEEVAKADVQANGGVYALNHRVHHFNEFFDGYKVMNGRGFSYLDVSRPRSDDIFEFLVEQRHKRPGHFALVLIDAARINPKGERHRPAERRDEWLLSASP